jgi:hypothetical protein
MALRDMFMPITKVSRDASLLMGRVAWKFV